MYTRSIDLSVTEAPDGETKSCTSFFKLVLVSRRAVSGCVVIGDETARRLRSIP